VGRGFHLQFTYLPDFLWIPGLLLSHAAGDLLNGWASPFRSCLRAGIFFKG
jgi:hypothetical protein